MNGNGSILKTVFRNTRPQRFLFYLATLAASLVSFSLNGMFKELIAFAEAEGPATAHLLLALLLCVLSVLCTFASVWLKGPFCVRLGVYLRDLVYKNLFFLSGPQFRQLGQTRPVSLFSKNIQEYCSALSNSLEGLAVNGLTLCLGLLVILYLDWKIAVVYVGCIFALVILWLFVVRSFRQLREMCRVQNLQLSDQALQLFQGLSIIRAHGAQESYFEALNEGIVQQAQLESQYQKWASIQESIGAQLGPVFSLLYLLYISGSLYTGSLSFSNAAFLLFIISMTTQALGELYPCALNLSTVDQLWETDGRTLLVEQQAGSDSVLASEPVSTGEPIRAPHKLSPVVEPIEIRLDQVAYTYPGSEHRLFDPLTLQIPFGSKVLITGPSGSGKSTFLSILQKEIVDYQGSIAVNGVELREIQEADWQRSFVTISQNVELFTASLCENITLDFSGDCLQPEQEARIWELLEQVALREFVETLPDGLQAQLEEGGRNLSGGQRARIAMVRALYHRSPILLVDEPTAALPRDLAEQVESLLLTWEGTLIAIYHRSLSDAYDHRIQLAS